MGVLRILRLLLIPLWSAQGGVVAQDEPGFGLAMTHLELSLDLDHDRGSLAGSASYRIANMGERPVQEVPFNLGRMMTVESVRLGGEGSGGDGGGREVEFTQAIEVFADSPRRQVNHVVVSLPSPLEPGDEVRLQAEYGGFLVGYTETGSVYIQDRVVWNALIPYLEDGRFSILREDAFAWPVLGTLHARANRVAPRPDFTFRAAITVPEPFTVASSGRLLRQETRDGRRLFAYESSDPVPFLNLPIAEYAVLKRPGVRVYHFPADSAGAARVLDAATDGLALLARWFGPLGVEPDLAVMEIPERWGSQASLTGGIIQTADAFGQDGSLSPLYHELSHLWNAPDLDQPSARWNEGLATFLSYRMSDDMDGSESMDAAVQRTVDRLLATASRSPTLTSVPFAEYGEVGATNLSYRVGFLMFYALEAGLGQETLNSVLRGFYQDHKDRGWTFEGLAEELQARTPQDLSGFVEDWIITTAWFDQLQAGVPPHRIGLER
jgi:aminopeptidase N